MVKIVLSVLATANVSVLKQKYSKILRNIYNSHEVCENVCIVEISLNFKKTSIYPYLASKYWQEYIPHPLGLRLCLFLFRPPFYYLINLRMIWRDKIDFLRFSRCSSLYVKLFNAFHVGGECRRQVKNVTKCFKNIEIVDFHVHIWSHNEKCIQISPNMPGTGSLIREIAG